ncbi:MAG: alpha/beta fold hydrolase [Gemmataceae bacterium]
MMLTTAIVISLSLRPIIGLPTAVWQPSREKQNDVPNLAPQVTKTKAVLLVPGLWLHPFKSERCLVAEMHDWQRPYARLVKELASDFDVYAISYAQTTPLDFISLSPGMKSTVAELKKAGYKEIVLVGHSAGGVISRQFVERYPHSGVTKVIQVSAPNYGSDYATISLGIPKPQLPFVKSLLPEFRKIATVRGPKLPEDVEFCCMVCQGGKRLSDTIVEFDSQWPEDLQKQGIPVVLVPSYHNEAVKAEVPVKMIGELAREKIVRWSTEDVNKARKVIFEPIKKPSRGLGFIRP